MKRNLVLLSISSLAACGPTKSFTPAPTAIPQVVRSTPELLTDDPEVTLIVNEFYADAQSLQHHLDRTVKSIGFVDQFDDGKSLVVGRCEFYADQNGRPVYRTVEILRSAWNAGSSQFKKTLLYHELGHCALSLEHAAYNSGAIMEPIVLPDDYASGNWLQLVHDEFKASSVSLTLTDTVDDILHITIR